MDNQIDNLKATYNVCTFITRFRYIEFSLIAIPHQILHNLPILCYIRKKNEKLNERFTTTISNFSSRCVFNLKVKIVFKKLRSNV